MWPRATFLAILQLGGASLARPTDQEPIPDVVFRNGAKVRSKLIDAEIIPTVIDDFLPWLSLSVDWTNDQAKLGNTIKPERLQDTPSLSLYDDSGSDVFALLNLTYVVTLTDPDAPSREDPKWSEMCHWIAANVSLAQKTFSILPFPLFPSQSIERVGPDDVVEYKPPGPPPKTGKHRYVFLAFAPKNGTSEPLDLKAPTERQHWGTGKEGGGVREWAEGNGLVPVAANFIYSKNKKQ